MQRTALSTKETPASANAMSWSPLLKRSAPVLQRKCACGGTHGPTGECEACRRKRLQRAASQPSTINHQLSEAPPIVHEVLRTSGQPLEVGARRFMESRFGHDFSRVRTHANGTVPLPARLAIGAPHDEFEHEAERVAQRTLSRSAAPGDARRDFSGVRIHTDARAAESAHAVNAKAYTVGQDIVFGLGRYAPDTDAGRKLLAHELAHTIQQSRSGSPPTACLQRTIGDGHDLRSPRFAGDLVLEACFDNERFVRFGSRGPAVEKIQQALIDAGFPLPKFGVDGIFESETAGAVRDYQRARGLVPDALVGPITMGTLDAEFAAPGPPAPAPAPPAPAPPAPAPPAPAPPGPAPAPPGPAPAPPGPAPAPPGPAPAPPGPAPAPPGPAPAPPGPAPAPPGPAPAPPGPAPAPPGPAPAPPGPAPAPPGPAPVPPAPAETITSETVVADPAPRTRTKIGVGEEVTLTHTPGAAAWSAPLGRFSVANGPTTIFTAPDTAQARLTVTGGAATIDFEIVAPTSVSMDREPGTGVMHALNRPTSGIRARVFLGPDTVNFNKVIYHEMDVAGVATAGAYSCNPFSGGHCGAGGGGVACPDKDMLTTVVAGKGTQSRRGDCATSGDCCGIPLAAGSVSLSIPYEYKVGAGAFRAITNVPQVHALAANLSTLTTDKAGAHGDTTVAAPSATVAGCTLNSCP